MTHQRRRIVSHTSGQPATATTSFSGDDPPVQLDVHSQHCTRNRGICHGHFDTTAVSFATTLCDGTANESPSHDYADAPRNAMCMPYSYMYRITWMSVAASLVKLQRSRSSEAYRPLRRTVRGTHSRKQYKDLASKLAFAVYCTYILLYRHFLTSSLPTVKHRNARESQAIGLFIRFSFGWRSRSAMTTMNVRRYFAWYFFLLFPIIVRVRDCISKATIVIWTPSYCNLSTARHFRRDINRDILLPGDYLMLPWYDKRSHLIFDTSGYNPGTRLTFHELNSRSTERLTESVAICFLTEPWCSYI